MAAVAGGTGGGPGGSGGSGGSLLLDGIIPSRSKVRKIQYTMVSDATHQAGGEYL